MRILRSLEADEVIEAIWVHLTLEVIEVIWSFWSWRLWYYWGHWGHLTYFVDIFLQVRNNLSWLTRSPILWIVKFAFINFFQQNFHHVVFVTEVHLFYVNLVAPHTTTLFCNFLARSNFFQHAKQPLFNSSSSSSSPKEWNIIGPGPKITAKINPS